jgi:hypothetical protein
MDRYTPKQLRNKERTEATARLTGTARCPWCAQMVEVVTYAVGDTIEFRMHSSKPSQKRVAPSKGLPKCHGSWKSFEDIPDYGWELDEDIILHGSGRAHLP